MFVVKLAYWLTAKIWLMHNKVAPHNDTTLIFSIWCTKDSIMFLAQIFLWNRIWWQNDFWRTHWLISTKKLSEHCKSINKSSVISYMKFFNATQPFKFIHRTVKDNPLLTERHIQKMWFRNLLAFHWSVYHRIYRTQPFPMCKTAAFDRNPTSC